MFTTEEKMKIIIFIIFLHIIITTNILSQACCTAGTPLLSSLEMHTASQGVLSFGLIGKYNFLTNVYSGSNFLENKERKRTTQTYIFETNYGITKQISLSALLSYINNLRSIKTISNLENNVNVKGVGDALILLKYNLITLDLFDRTELSLGLGTKLPLGSSTIKRNSVLLPADMQPGTGSVDGLLWIYFSKGNLIIPQITFLANSSYRLNGTNKRFGKSQSGYKFGNELIFTLGLAYSTDTFVEFTLLARYRNVGADKFGSEDIPNTGGNWFFILPGFNFKISDKLTVTLYSELPAYTNVVGIQLTTTFTASLSMYYSINITNGLEL